MDWFSDRSRLRQLIFGGGRFDPATTLEAWTAPCRRVLRGGSWNNNPQNLRSANRNRNTTDNRNNNLAFRVARTLSAWSVTSSASIAVVTALWGLLASFTGARVAIAIAGILMFATLPLLPRPPRLLRPQGNARQLAESGEVVFD